MKTVAIIPARYASTRFPAKMMQLLHGKTVIRHTYDNALSTGLFEEVLVATDTQVIYDEIVQNGGKAMMTTGRHHSGTDRVAEAAQKIEADVILNIQGDTPFVNKNALQKIIEVFHDEKIQVASMMQPLELQQYIDDPNYVKVAVDKNNNALLFSRSVIPHPRNKKADIIYYEHIGVYAFRKQALTVFAQSKMTPLEHAEKIECLRFLENGLPIKMIIVNGIGVEIDTPEDLAKAEKLFR